MMENPRQHLAQHMIKPTVNHVTSSFQGDRKGEPGLEKLSATLQWNCPPTLGRVCRSDTVTVKGICYNVYMEGF